MRNSKRYGLLILIVLGLVFVGVAVAAPMRQPEAPAVPQVPDAAFNINWQVLGGGGQRLSGGSYVMESTFGQPLAGEMTGTGRILNNGFWQNGNLTWKSFLPFGQK